MLYYSKLGIIGQLRKMWLFYNKNCLFFKHFVKTQVDSIHFRLGNVEICGGIVVGALFVVIIQHSSREVERAF